MMSLPHTLTHSPLPLTLLPLPNSYVLPFHEVIDWSKSTISVDERHLLQITHITRSMATQQVSLRMEGERSGEGRVMEGGCVCVSSCKLVLNSLVV